MLTFGACEMISKKRNKKRNKFNNFIISINIEKLLFSLFIAFFSALIIAQTIIIIAGVDKGLTSNNSIEGMPIKKEEFLFKQGNIVLQLLSYNKEQGNKISILINGEEIGTFSTKEVSLDVKNGDLIEIDSTDFMNNIDIIIKNKSSNIKINDLSEKYSVKSQVKQIIRVKID